MDWLKEKAIGVLMAVFAFSVLSAIGGGNMPVDPIATPLFIIMGFVSALGGFLFFVGAIAFFGFWWVTIPAAVLGVTMWCFRRPDMLTVTIDWDEHGLPFVRWDEPRFDARRWIFKATQVRGCCWLRLANDEWQLCYQLDPTWPSDASFFRIDVPLWQVTGFSVTNAAALYRQGHQGELADGHHLVVRVDLDPPHRGLAFIPLTFTCASSAEVESLHRALATSFSATSLAAALEALAVEADAGRQAAVVTGASGIPQRLA